MKRSYFLLATALVGIPLMAQEKDSLSTKQKTIVEKSTDTLATLIRNKPKREKRKAATTVANTSKNPSTQRCTTHQRQYSATAICVCLPYISPAP